MDRALHEEEIESRLILTNKFEEIARIEEMAWRQRSRAIWLKEGDKNTRFFHKTANTHRRSNTIDKLKVEGVMIEDPEEIKREIVSFYENLYIEHEEWRPQLEMINCPKITERENHMLEASFEPQEIQEGINACTGDKAPGLDGYTMEFFKQCWDIIKVELVATIQNFHKRSYFEKKLQFYFCGLNTKKVGAIE